MEMTGTGKSIFISDFSKNAVVGISLMSCVCECLSFCFRPAILPRRLNVRP